MTSPTLLPETDVDGQRVVISFYKEKPGGWKLNFEDETRRYIKSGDRWVENLDDLVLQLALLTPNELEWRESDGGEPVSFYAAVKRCVL